MPKGLSDAAVRAVALDPARSFIVQAPAGSGKTELLIRRYLVLLAGAATPDEIVAITFTRKAAGEMRGRVLDALARAAAPAPARPHERETWELAQAALARDASLGWRLTEHPARLRVLTIDAFCLMLARRMPWLSRLGGVTSPVDDAGPLYRRAARATLAALEGAGALAQSAARLLLHLDNQAERAEELLADLLARRDQWQRHLNAPDPAALRQVLEAALGRVVAEALEAVRAHITGAGQERELCALAVHAAANLRAEGRVSPILACAAMAALPAPQAEALPAWLGLAELLLTREGTWRKALNVTIGFLPGGSGAEGKRAKEVKGRLAASLAALAQVPGLEQRLHALRVLPPVRYGDGQWRVMEALLALLPPAVEHLRGEFRRAGQVDFVEVAQAARDGLAASARAPQGAADEPGPRHLLVDEFQDTSASQALLLERLTADWRDGDGRTLFLVGDPMQSIYRFREAEVGLFLRARSRGLGALKLTPLTLRANFRSVEDLVAWNNGAFAQALPPEEDIAEGAVPYSASAAVNPAGASPAVRVHPVLTWDGASDPSTREAEQVAALAAEALAERPGEAVAILVRARTHLAQILPALTAAGLPWRAVEIEPLAEQPAVLDLLALTRALLFPADRVAWLSVLRAPWCGLALADLLALAGEGGAAAGSEAGERGTAGALWDRIVDDAACAWLSADGRARLRRARAALTAALARRGRGSLRAWVEGAWLALGGPACLAPPALAHARAFLRVLEELDEAGDEPTPEELERRVEGLYAEPDASVEGAIQVMTLHKAKGLEFDTVILPGLGRRTRGAGKPLLRWAERPTAAGDDLLLAPVGQTGDDDDPIFRYLAHLERRKAGHETGRLMYVAATRAKRRLHLLGEAQVTEDGVRAPAGSTLLAVVWPAVEAEFERARAALEARGSAPPTPAVAKPAAGATARAAPPEAAGPLAPGTIRRLAAGWSAPPPPPDVHPAAQPPAEAAAAIEFAWAGATARAVGSAVHRLLLRISREGAAAWPATRVREHAPLLQAALAQLGVAQAELAPAVERAVQAVLAALAHPRGQWVLAPHAHGRAEYELTALAGGLPRRLRVDRTFVDEQGRRWIVDYKTGTHEGGGREEFLAREQERYREPMESYARAFRALEPERPIRLALYYPLLDGWQEWEYVGVGAA
jgi:ATP-dependent exoDNAse (exonuclease V) beta subunit